MEKTAWEKAASADGTTPSERALANLARKAFLTLWSYPNVFTDEGRGNGKGDGKELCDLLVVFGNDVLLFSDKDCAFQSNVDVSVAWPRWYRSAIDKSAKQLAGAENFIKAYPKRVFLDRACRSPLPVELPHASVARYYLIAVTRGSHLPAQQFFGGGSSGSLILFTHLVGKAAHAQMPFRIGFPLDSRRFVHVVDEVTVDLLLDELDTVPDLVRYLKMKEEYLQQPGVIVSVPGEEELLARYMSTIRDEEHAFPEIPKGIDFVTLPEGDWDVYRASPQWKAKQEANEISYLWDALIEHQSGFIRSGKAITIPWQPSTDGVNHERIVRALAAQPRLARRNLATDLRHVMSRSSPGTSFARIKMTGSPPAHAFVFLTIPRTEGEDYDTIYRQRRVHTLMVYCHAIKGKVPTLEEAIGIASEPFSEGTASQDFMHVDLSEMSQEEINMWLEQAGELDILRSETEVNLFRQVEPEFPTPFQFVDSAPAHLGAGGSPMNRAARRKADKEARRKLKRRY